MADNPRLTAEDLLRMGESDMRRELVNGEVIEMPPSNALHGMLTVELSHRLTEFVHAQGGGKVLTDVGFILKLPDDPERVRGPDVAFISTDRLPSGKLPEKFIRGAPDLAVEVTSPDDSAADVQRKVLDYIFSGTRLVWVVTPRTRSVTVYRPDGSARLLCEPEQLDGEDVLPGLKIALSDLFAG